VGAAAKFAGVVGVADGKKSLFNRAIIRHDVRNLLINTSGQSKSQNRRSNIEFISDFVWKWK